MTKFNYIYFKKDKKLRILNSKFNSNVTVVFLHGLKSDMEGKKPLFLNKYCMKNKVNFLSLEYSGHGKSYGKFENGTISKWKNNVKLVIKKIIKKEKFLIVGLSLGACLGLLQFQDFKKQIIGFIGIGSAPEFLDRLIWQKLKNNEKKLFLKKKFYMLKSDGYEYKIKLALLKDGRKNKVLKKRINLKIPVFLMHGKKDDVVPLKLSKKIFSIFPKAKKKIQIIKGGDHSLSRKGDLNKLANLIDEIIY